MVLVDTDTSRENVSRAAASLGWQVKAVQPDGAMNTGSSCRKLRG